MAPDQDSPRRVSRKLTKKRKPIRASSVQYPERLREGEDVQEDVTAANGRPAQYMHKSVFSMIAAAGSKVDFNAPYDEESSESEEDPVASESTRHGFSINDSVAKEIQRETLRNQNYDDVQSSEMRSRGPDRRGLHALPNLSLKNITETSSISRSTILPPPEEPLITEENSKGLTPRDAPVMSKMLEAQAEFNLSTSPLEAQKGDARKIEQSVLEKGPTKLVLRLKEIFGFEEIEEVISGVLDNIIVIARFFTN